MTKAQRFELIERYHAGTLTAAQKRLVDRLCMEDPTFEQELHEYREMWEALGPSDVNAFRGLTREVIDEASKPVKKKNIIPVTFLVAAAIVLFVSVGIWWWFGAASASSGTDLFAAYFDPPTQAVFRNGADPTADDLSADIKRQINAHYIGGEYELALSKMETYTRQFPKRQSSDYHYLLGHVHLRLGQPQEALAAFDSIVVGYQYDKPWNYGLALLLAEETDRARAIFLDISESKGPYRDKAAEILRALER